jgi:hypothetical protein
VDKAIQFIGLWHHRDAASLALKVGTKLVIHDLKTIGNALNGWRLGSLILAQAGHACLAADRTP